MDLRKALGLESLSPEENSVHYELFASEDIGDNEESLLTLKGACLEQVLPAARSYTWQHDRFELHTSAERSAPWQRKRRGARDRDRIPCLWGKVTFTDNVEDEWMVVGLLLELTRATPGLCARVWDNDGEFLLIEAAYHLPKRMTPELAENRVWLRGGSFHLIPLDQPVAGPISKAQGLKALRELDDRVTLAPNGVRKALADRLGSVPSTSAEQTHVAHAVLPARTAALLQSAPQLLPAIVEAFYYRDVDDAKAVTKPKLVHPEDLCRIAVRFSRCLYAQMALQDFPGLAGYLLPLRSDPEYQPVSLGSKLSAGLEMLLRHHDGDASFVGMAEPDAFQDATPEAYATLTEALREPEALAYAVYTDRRLDDVAEQVIQEAARSDTLPEEGSLDWLAEGQAQLDMELEKRQDERARASTDAPTVNVTKDEEEEEYDPSVLAERMRAFLNAGASLEGAEVPTAPESDGTLPGLSVGSFLHELRTALGMPKDNNSSDSEASSFYSDEEDDEEEFEGAYDEVLREQMRAAECAARPAETTAQASAPTASPLLENLEPVDVDANLVESLLASVGMQGGTAGPASNLAALLGVHLPDSRHLNE